ncbi:MAG: hypothetical protein OXG13_18080 [Gemmatimonadaceae bacterium]|nr:hypothetical protein [Gemmatimonadaceae bacterium]
MKVAAWQAPLLPSGSMEALPLIRERIAECERRGVEVLCCPEAILGGLADYAPEPGALAIDAEGGELERVLQPLGSDRVSTVVGFTDAGPGGRLYCSAAVFQEGAVTGVYRKTHPAIRRSVYSAGDRTPVFDSNGLRFGIVVCYDSNFREPARTICSRGASVLFIPTNNGLPPEKADVVPRARRAQAERAVENRVHVVAADVAGRCGDHVSWGSSGVTAPDGTLLAAAEPLAEELLVVDLDG